jgi:hypothetical protein
VVLRQPQQLFAQSLQPQDVHNMADRERVIQLAQLKVAVVAEAVSLVVAVDIVILVHQMVVAAAVQVS